MRWESSTYSAQTWYRIGDTWVSLEHIRSMEVTEDPRLYKGGQWRIYFRLADGGGVWAEGFGSNEEAHNYIRGIFDQANLGATE